MADQNYLDPEEDVTTPAPGDTSSTDNSRSGVRRAWDAWTSKPENNAALLQFGVAMMQPRGQGQTSLGQFGNAIAEGAGASDRNIAAQRAEEDRGQLQEDRTVKNDLIRAQTGAATSNASAYSRIADAQGGNSGKSALSNSFRVQQAFRTWLAKPEDTTGMTQDPLLGVIKKQFPGVQTKSDLVGNPAAQKRAFELYTQQFATEPPDTQGTPAAPAQPASPPPRPPPVAGAKWYNGQWVTRGPNGEAVPITGQ